MDSNKQAVLFTDLEPLGSFVYRRLIGYGIHVVVAGWVLVTVILSGAATAALLSVLYGSFTLVDLIISAAITCVVTTPIAYKITGLIFELNASRASLHRAAQCDVLTGIANRGYFFKRLTFLLSDDEVRAYPMAALMIDADHFKSINDDLGHATGDEVIKQLARVLQTSLRATDFIARYGGEEFVVGLPNTPQFEAMNIAEHLRTTVAANDELQSLARARITVSIGIAVANARMTPDNLLLMADQALYSAKAAGRNCTEFQEAVDTRSVTARRRALFYPEQMRQ